MSQTSLLPLVYEIQWFEISWAADSCRSWTVWLRVETFDWRCFTNYQKIGESIFAKIITKKLVFVIYLARTLMVLDFLWEVPDAHALVYWPRPTGRTSHFTISIVEVTSIPNKGICPVFYSVLLSRTLAKDITNWCQIVLILCYLF